VEDIQNKVWGWGGVHPEVGSGLQYIQDKVWSWVEYIQFKIGSAVEHIQD
jgi:hypothetical protein